MSSPLRSPLRDTSPQAWTSRRSPQKNIAHEPHYYRDPVKLNNAAPRSLDEFGLVNRTAVVAADLFADDLTRHEQLCELFKRFDVNKSNTLEPGELTELLRYVLVVSEALFYEDWLHGVVKEAFATRRFDRNRDGRMDKCEYFSFMEQFMQRDCLLELLEEVRPLFFLEATFDPRKLLSTSDVAALIKKLHEGIGVICNDTDAHGMAQEGMAQHDGDHDGFLNFFEFVRLLRLIREYLLEILSRQPAKQENQDAGLHGGMSREEYLAFCDAKNAKGNELSHNYDFDKHGLLYWIGSKAANELWSNPAMNGVTPTREADVVVCCALDPVSMIAGDVRHVLDRGGPMYKCARPQVFRITMPPSKSASSPWVKIDLGPTREFVPKMYTLRHSGEGGEMRNWVLEGSCFGTGDPADWAVLAKHVNDESLKGKGSTASWPITDARKAFRYYRITATGADAAGTLSLDCAGFELYGIFLREYPDY